MEICQVPTGPQPGSPLEHETARTFGPNQILLLPEETSLGSPVLPRRTRTSVSSRVDLSTSRPLRHEPQQETSVRRNPSDNVPENCGFKIKKVLSGPDGANSLGRSSQSPEANKASNRTRIKSQQEPS